MIKSDVTYAYIMHHVKLYRIKALKRIVLCNGEVIDKGMLRDKNRENYEKEATKFINSIQEKIEVFKKSLEVMKDNSVVEESEDDKK